MMQAIGTWWGYAAVSPGFLTVMVGLIVVVAIVFVVRRLWERRDG
ncbi:MAG: hypothetical protein R3B48_26665 [Kofleriaceae bacterium]